MLSEPQFLSLWKMLRFDATYLITVAKTSGMLDGYAEPRRPDTSQPMPPMHSLGEQMTAMAKHFESLGLDAAAASAWRVSAQWKNGAAFDDLRREAADLESRLQDQIRARLCFIVAPGKTRYITDRNLFGTDVADEFPAAIADIEEAAKCFAFERGTACIFHLMRVMEAGLKRLAKQLGIPYAPSWESYINQINTRISAKHRQKGIKWKKDEPYFRDCLGDLLAVKIAWRNPTMHIVRTYSPEEAADVFSAVRGLMQRIAAREQAKKTISSRSSASSVEQVQR